MSFLFLDIETMRFDPKSKKPDYHRDQIVTVQFLTEEGDFYIIKGAELNDLPEYKELFESFTVVGHNLKFDCGMLKQQYGISILSVHDTMLAELVLSGGPAPADSFRTSEDRDKKGMGLKDLVYRYCEGERMSKGLQCSFNTAEKILDIFLLLWQSSSRKLKSSAWNPLSKQKWQWFLLWYGLSFQVCITALRS